MLNVEARRPGLGYYQAASVALLLIITGFSIAGLWGVVGIVAPALTIETYDWHTVSSRSVYIKRNYLRRHGLYYATVPGDSAGITVDDVTERWRDARAEALVPERRDGMQRVALWVVALVVCLPLYRVHQRVVARAMTSSGEDGA